jgi:hypothetical protein
MTLDKPLLQNLKYYTVYQILYVSAVIILTSIGSFFHFLLDHEISIVESWLHNNHWELLITSKLLSLFLLNRWFTVRLYEFRTVRELVKDLVRWPEPKAIVISLFAAAGVLALGQIEVVPQNFSYWYYHITSFLGLFLFFGIEFIVIVYLDDILHQRSSPPNKLGLALAYIAIFSVAFRLSMPDYYNLMSYVIFCYSVLIYLSGKSFRIWSNVVCFLLLFVAPMGSLVGLDPVWGDDFSPFKVGKHLNVTLLAAVWVISFLYYNYRDQVLFSARKLFR